MISLHKMMATGFGIGYIGKGGGTVAALATTIALYLAFSGSHFHGIVPVSAVFIIIVLGIWSGNMLEPYWGKDSSKIVIDEIAGMCVSVLFLPLNLTVLVAGLILFRFFDIVKPLFIRKTEKLGGGLGVMADDVLAGIYANIILQILLIFRIF